MLMVPWLMYCGLRVVVIVVAETLLCYFPR